MMQNRPNIGTFSGFKKVEQIFIGIDFGTSFTKVSYSYAPVEEREVQTIKWGHDFFKPSIVYIQDGKFDFEKPNKCGEEVKYFKYSIIDERLRNNHIEETKNSFEELCCVFFLAHVINKSIKFIESKLKIGNINDIKIHINMGAPLENFYGDKNKDKYLNLLKKAISLVTDEELSLDKQISIKELDEFYSKITPQNLKYKAGVFPELAMEMMLYQQSRSIPEGSYIIVDVGGGTVDMALFQKYFNSNKKNCMYCNGQKVLPFGIEILKQDKELKRTGREKYQEEFSDMITKVKKAGNLVNFDKKIIDVFFFRWRCF